MPNSAEKADHIDIAHDIETIAGQVKAIGDMLGLISCYGAELNSKSLESIGSLLEGLGDKLESVSKEI